MKYIFPPREQGYLQTNRSDVLGSLWSTFNLDFLSNLGVVRLAKKLVTNTTSSDDGDLGVPCAFEFWNSKWWAICNTTIFSNPTADITGAFTEDAGTGAVKDYSFHYSDLETFDDRLWSTNNAKLYSLVATTWTERDVLTSNVPHKLQYFKKHDRLYYFNNVDTISSINAANSVADPGADYAIDLGDSIGRLSTMVATSDFIWIGTIKAQNTSGDNGTLGSILAWDGFSAQVTDDKTFSVAGCLAMCVLNDVPYAMDSEGRVLRFSGYGFEEVARLPIDKILLRGATLSAGALAEGRFIHMNGMVATKNNTIQVLIRNRNEDASGTITENIASGIWELDLETKSFTHKHSFTLKAMGSSAITDFGQNRINSAGALKLNPFSEAGATGRGTLLAGCSYFTDATTTKAGIFIDSPTNANTDNEGQKRGYFVTTWFDAEDILEYWEAIWAMFRLFLAATDKITFKYRLSEVDPTGEITITWVNTTSFTTTTDVLAYIGFEVEVLRGTGGGSCSKITNVVNNGGTYTVTLDNAVTGVTTGTAVARFQKWINLLPEITGQVDAYAQVPIMEKGTRIQLKILLQWTGNGEFYKFLLKSKEQININNQ